MVYGNASLLGVPWETIVKMFRRTLGADQHPHLEDYGKQLLAYLNDNSRLFPLEVQDEHFHRHVAHGAVWPAVLRDPEETV